MKPFAKALILLNLGLLLAYLCYYVVGKEKTLREGDLLLLELAPVDPRSLIQGDYMDLNYAISRGINNDSIPRKGYVVVRRNTEGVAEKLRLQPTTDPLAEGEYLINYTRPNWRINIGAESYFFQEGTASTYEAAKYGGLRVDNRGNSLLVGLYDEERRLLK
ncbi:MAG: GDYXXLXY domain-containing protein [Bacteroidota bacterium]